MIAAPVLVNVVLAVSVIAPVYVCVPEVVTLAARLETVDTLKLVAELIAASRLSAPVMAIAPSPVLPPTIPENWVSPPFVTTVVRLFAPFTVPAKEIPELISSYVIIIEPDGPAPVL